MFEKPTCLESSLEIELIENVSNRNVWNAIFVKRISQIKETPFKSRCLYKLDLKWSCLIVYSLHLYLFICLSFYVSVNMRSIKTTHISNPLKLPCQAWVAWNDHANGHISTKEAPQRNPPLFATQPKMAQSVHIVGVVFAKPFFWKNMRLSQIG